MTRQDSDDSPSSNEITAAAVAPDINSNANIDKENVQQQSDGNRLSSSVVVDDVVISMSKTSNLMNNNNNNNDVVAVDHPPILSRTTLHKEISKQVLRHKLQKLRHLVIEQAISPAYLDSLFPQLLELFDPQTVTYNGGIAKIKQWKISCYLEVMEGGIPCTNPNMELRQVFLPLLETCNDLFLAWYRQQHACNTNTNNSSSNSNAALSKRKRCHRLMTFITRYTPNPGEQALLKHVDGAGKVDGSVVVALPIDRWSAPYAENSFEGHGGGITFWDGKETIVVDETETGSVRQQRPREIHYETRSGDVAFIDRAVWHQADPITKGTRWALVIFYKVEDDEN
ncbi:hypothetical protein IV203_005202 [Nitzschia inconspicua]|uniref:Uncharacterized protein n=1 Tax=Nitzschia inconspicua TaxID=303405 RepID=A0A9K3KN34_9STRA|nr:hypothetical protein IV203_005202 [Nitzschia inconspicua]